MLDEGAVGGQVRHPDGGPFLEREISGERRHGVGWNDDGIPVDPVLPHGKGGQGAYAIPDLEPGDARPDGLDGPRRFVPEAGGEARGFEIRSLPEKAFRAVQADGLDGDPDLAVPGRRRRHLLDPEHLGPAGLVKSYYFRHRSLLPAIRGPMTSSKPAAGGKFRLRRVFRRIRYRRLMKVPFRYSSNAIRISSAVFITMGPYQATGSPIGFPETRRKRTGSLSAAMDTASPSP